MTVHTSHRRRRVRGVVAATLAIAVACPVLGWSAAASAGPLAPSESTIRVAHFSPDTPAMDVYAAGFDGAESLVLPKLGFGEVSQYMRLPAGTYAFSMRPHGAPATSTAALRVSASLDGGGIYTFAAFGRSDALETELLVDDMAAPGADRARARIIQAAGDQGPVDVTTGASPLFAQRARLGAVGSYVDVPAGSLDVTASAAGTDDEVARVDLAAGTVSSVVVLDGTAGGLQVVRVTDGTGTPGGVATPTGMPAGGVDTGAGGNALGDDGRSGAVTVGLLVGGAAAAVAASGFALAVVRPHTRRRPI